MRGKRQGTKRKDGRWQIILTLTAENGGKFRQPFYAETQRGVQKKVDDFLRENEERRPTPNITLTKFLDLWVERKGHTWSSSTSRHYNGAIKRYLKPQLGDIRLKELKPTDVDEMCLNLQSRGLIRVPSLARDILRTALKYALKNDLIKRNVAELADHPGYERVDREMISLEEWLIVVDAELDPTYKALWRLLGESGHRPSEDRTLSWPEIYKEDDGYWIRLEKAKTKEGKRPIPISNELYDSLKAIRADSLFVFPNLKGVPFHERTIQEKWRDACEWAGVSYTNLYQLRKMFGREKARTVPDHILKRLMRHTDIRTTKQFYVDAEKRELRASVSISKSMSGKTEEEKKNAI